MVIMGKIAANQLFISKKKNNGKLPATNAMLSFHHESLS
jgi:hypothetical protein